jgi:hypothetical protein
LETVKTFFKEASWLVLTSLVLLVVALVTVVIGGSVNGFALVLALGGCLLGILSLRERRRR